MGEIKLFEKKEFGAVRIVIRNGNPWFGAKDVAAALGYADTDDAVRRHCNYAELFKPGELPGLEIGPRGMYFIPEPDVPFSYTPDTYREPEIPSTTIWCPSGAE